MDMPQAPMRVVAQRLLAVEAANRSATDVSGHDAVRVCEKLRISLVRLAGSDGFAALLRRTLALATAEVPALAHVTVNTDCSIEGLHELASNTADGGVDGPVAITAHLLGLLATFIGEPLTLRLVREAWPDASLEG
jgi:hypothetical protein